MATLAAWLCGSSDKPDRFARPDYTVAFGRDYDSDGEVPLEAVAACWGSSDMVAASWGQMCAANLDLERETRRCLPKLLAEAEDDDAADAARPANWPADYVLDLARDDGSGAAPAPAPGESPPERPGRRVRGGLRSDTSWQTRSRSQPPAAARTAPPAPVDVRAGSDRAAPRPRARTDSGSRRPSMVKAFSAAVHHGNDGPCSPAGAAQRRPSKLEAFVSAFPAGDASPRPDAYVSPPDSPFAAPPEPAPPPPPAEAHSPVDYSAAVKPTRSPRRKSAARPSIESPPARPAAATPPATWALDDADAPPAPPDMRPPAPKRQGSKLAAFAASVPAH